MEPILFPDSIIKGISSNSLKDEFLPSNNCRTF